MMHSFRELPVYVTHFCVPSVEACLSPASPPPPSPSPLTSPHLFFFVFLFSFFFFRLYLSCQCLFWCPPFFLFFFIYFCSFSANSFLQSLFFSFFFFSFYRLCQFHFWSFQYKISFALRVSPVGDIFAPVTVFNPTKEVTIRLQEYHIANVPSWYSSYSLFWEIQIKKLYLVVCWYQNQWHVHAYMYGQTQTFGAVKEWIVMVYWYS